jgi:predicted phage-related endonuclease
MAPNDLGLVFPKSRPWRDSTLIEGAESWMLGAPDGWMPAVNSGLEVKCSARKGDEWGEEGSDDVPVHYFVQVSWYMAVCNADAWNFATLFSGNKLEQFRIVRDTGFEHDLIEAGRAFWFDNVLKQVEPDIDESESYGKYLARKFSLNTGKIINDPSQEILDWTEKMKTAEETERQAAADKQLANNHLRALIGDAQKAITPLGSMGWVRPKEGESTDWKAAAERLSALYEDARSADAVPAADVIKEATSPEHRSAYLRAWWAKKKDKVFAEAGEF